MNLKKMQLRVDRLLSVFSKLIETLENNISELISGIQRNRDTINTLEHQNVVYNAKIEEYKVLVKNVKGFINRE